MAIKSILFDADGVVINSEMFSVQYQKKCGLTNDVMQAFFKEDFLNCIIRKADLIEVLKTWLPAWKWTGTATEFLELWFASENNVDERMLSIIGQLRKGGIKCFLATNQEKYRTEYMRTQMLFSTVFDRVFSSSEIGYKKPEKEFYEALLKEIENKYALPPAEIMFFDDSLENIIAAKELGIDAHLYKDFEDFKQTINSLAILTGEHMD